jgi:hypothetical protein
MSIEYSRKASGRRDAVEPYVFVRKRVYYSDNTAVFARLVPGEDRVSLGIKKSEVGPKKR